MADLFDAQAHAEAERRIRAAMAHVERAQLELEKACQDPCDVAGAAMFWKAIGQLTDRARAAWGRLARLAESGKFDLDGTGRAALKARQEPRDA